MGCIESVGWLVMVGAGEVVGVPVGFGLIEGIGLCVGDVVGFGLMVGSVVADLVGGGLKVGLLVGSGLTVGAGLTVGDCVGFAVMVGLLVTVGCDVVVTGLAVGALVVGDGGEFGEDVEVVADDGFTITICGHIDTSVNSRLRKIEPSSNNPRDSNRIKKVPSLPCKSLSRPRRSPAARVVLDDDDPTTREVTSTSTDVSVS